MNPLDEHPAPSPVAPPAMKPPTGWMRNGERARTVGWIGAACVACCVGPIVGFIALASAMMMAVMMTGFAGVIIGAFLVILMLRRRRKLRRHLLEVAVIDGEIE